MGGVGGVGGVGGSLGADGDGLIERRNTGKHLALEKLEAGAPSGRDVAHLLRDARLLNGRDRVSAADDRAATLGGNFGERVRNADRARGKGVEFEHTHGAVPHNRQRS